MSATSNRVIAIVILVLIFVFVGVGYLVNNAQEQIVEQEQNSFDYLYEQTLAGNTSEFNYVYNDFVFIKEDPLWKTIIQKQTGEQFVISLHYPPPDVLDIPLVPGARNTIIPKQQIYLTTDTNLTSRSVTAIYEVGRLLGNRFDVFNIPTQAATTTPSEGVLTITCDNVTDTVGVIYFTLNEVTAVGNDGCIYILGTTEEEIVRAADRLVYDLLQIVPGDVITPNKFETQLIFADWKDDPVPDGFRFIFEPKDAQGRDISVEGNLNISIFDGEQLIQNWRTPVLLDYYNQSGTAVINLGVEDPALFVQRTNLTTIIEYAYGDVRINATLS